MGNASPAARVWTNRHHLGRYWKIGPQQTLLVPAGWLQRGSNEIIVLELESSRQRSAQGLTDPVYSTPGTPLPATDN